MDGELSADGVELSCVKGTELSSSALVIKERWYEDASSIAREIRGLGKRSRSFSDVPRVGSLYERTKAKYGVWSMIFDSGRGCGQIQGEVRVFVNT